MINFKNGIKYDSPFPYMVVENCFDKDTFNNLINEFPDTSKSETVMGGRRQINSSNSKTSYQDYENWIKNAPTWKSFYDYLNDDILLKSKLDEYQTEMSELGSVLNSSNASLETNCFLHIDWSSAGDGYMREVHRDSPKRIWNFLIFFNDKDWEDGDFVIHSKEGGNFIVDRVVEAKANRGLFFLSTPNSYHSVSKQHSTNTLRNFIYGSYSHKNGEVFRG